jgi:hypothetical protein
MSTAERKKVYVLLAFIRGEKVASMLFPESDELETAYSIPGIAHQQAERLGTDWREKITYDTPPADTVALANTDKITKFEAFNPVSVKTFEQTMVAIFDSH